MSIHKKTPLTLIGEFPRMSQSGREKLAATLDGGCSTCDYNCRQNREVPFSATLRRRNNRATVVVQLQCNGCGRSVGGALSRADHYFWQSYPEWDKEFELQKEAEAETQRQEYVAKLDEKWTQQAADREEYRQQYSEWLRTSPEWRQMRRRVHARANGICESCLDKPAVHVHHQTYAMGRLPPAWRLRAVCEECHDAIHTHQDNWGIE